MTIREFRDKHQPNMDPMLLVAGEYLEHQAGLIFGHDFVTVDALDLAAAFMTRKMTEDARDEMNKAKEQAADLPFREQMMLTSGRFDDDDWEERWGKHDETYDV